MTEHDEPLTQYQNYYGSSAQRAMEGEADYVRLREAFYAGYRARPVPLLEPSRDALTYSPEGVRELTEQEFQVNTTRLDRAYQAYGRGPYSDASFDYLPAPDYVQHGTKTGRFPRRDPAKAERFAEAYGFQPNPVAGPSPETLERIHSNLKREGYVDYPVSGDTNPGFPAVTRSDTKLMPAYEPTLPGLEHTETVYEGPYGAPGPVPTPLSLQEGDDAAS